MSNLHVELIKFDNGETIPSTNNMYEVFGNGGKKWLHKKDLVASYQKKLQKRLETTQLYQLSRFQYTIIDMHIAFIIPHFLYWDKDTDNMIKPTVDAIKGSLGIDDSRNGKVFGEKVMGVDDYDYLLITILGHTQWRNIR